MDTLRDAATPPVATVALGIGAPGTLTVDRGLLGTLGRIPLLTAAEEVDLARAAEAGALAAERLTTDPDLDPDTRALLTHLATAGQAAFEQMVHANLRLVAYLARRRLAAGGCPLDYADLVAEGLPGLVRAVHKWDYTRGWKFSTYAVRWISSRQQLAIRRATGLSASEEEQRSWIRRCHADLVTELGRTPTDAEVSDRVGLSSARIGQLLTLTDVTHLDAPLSRDGSGGHGTVADLVGDQTVADPADVVAAAEQHAWVTDAVAGLPDRHRLLLVAHFGLDGEPAADVHELAGRYRLPAARVQATLDRALALLREATAPSDV